MAVEAIEVKYNRYLGSIITKITDKDSFTEKQEKELSEMFNDFSFTNEQIGQVKAQTNGAQTQFINQYATAGAIELIKEERQQALIDAQILKINAEIALVEAQTAQAVKPGQLIDAQPALIERQSDGYDDNLIVKAAEFEGGLASFAVNADSLSAQDAIDKFNATILQIKARA